MGRWESRAASLARTGGQDGQTAEPGRMVSQDGEPRWLDGRAREDNGGLE